MAVPSIDIARLSSEERLQLLDELWKSLSKDPSSVPFTQAQREDLDARLDEIEREGARSIPWDEVVRRIRQGG